MTIKIIITIVVAVVVMLFLFFSEDEETIEIITVKKNENYYQTKLCNKLQGKKEYRLADNTRVDCLTDKYAIEVDFAKKWAEAIGQSLYYAIKTNKKPAIALIINQEKEQRFLTRLNTVTSKLKITVMIIKKEN